MVDPSFGDLEKDAKRLTKWILEYLAPFTCLALENLFHPASKEENLGEVFISPLISDQQVVIQQTRRLRGLFVGGGLSNVGYRNLDKPQIVFGGKDYPFIRASIKRHL